MRTKIILTVYSLAFILSLWISRTNAAGPPDLYMDIDGDGKKDTALQLDSSTQEKVSVRIWVDNWDSSPFFAEPFFGIKMFFFHDHNKIQVNKIKSFANDTDHGGLFTPVFCIFNDLGVGIVQLEVSNFNCVNITDRLLLYTLEIQSTGSGKSEIEITVDYPTGGIIPGGEDCKKAHTEDCSGSVIVVNSDESNGDDDEEDDNTTTPSTTSTLSATTTTPASTTTRASNITTSVRTGSRISRRTTTISKRTEKAIGTNKIMPGKKAASYRFPDDTKALYSASTTVSANPEELSPESSEILKEASSETTTISETPAFRLIISPSSIILNSKGLLQFSAKTISGGDEVEGTYTWKISPASTIGSTIDKSGLFSVGSNTTCSNVMETIVATDVLHKKESAETTVLIKPKEPLLPGCKLSINLSSVTVHSGNSISFVATSSGKSCAETSYAWSINSNIGSTINTDGVYKAGKNDADSSAIDIIIVKDKANNTSASSIATVLPSKKAFLPEQNSTQNPQNKQLSKGSFLSKTVTIAVLAAVFLAAFVLFRRKK